MPLLKHLLLGLVLFISFSSNSQSEDLFSAYSIPVELKEKANAVVRLSSIDILIESQDEMLITEKRIVTVLNEEGNWAIQAYESYDKYNKIKSIEARVFNEEGEEIKKIKKRDFIDRSAVDGGTLYSDSRILLMGYTPVSYPYTVEFTCEKETSNTAAIPTWRPYNGYYVSVQNNEYKLSDKANLGLRYKEKNLNRFNIEKKITEKTLNYKVKNVPALEPEELSPSYYNFAPTVMVAVEHFSFYGVEGSAKNWLEFGNWVNNSLLEGRSVVSEVTKQEILSLTNAIEDPLKKAKVIFEYVQEHTRYISVQVGIGGVQPISALEVDELKYGDCKGLTNYTQSLLKIVGVESYYCIVESGRDIVDFEDDFASLEQGNHIILAIPNEDKEMVWLDCTSQIHPFNFIGDFTDSRNVLVVKPNASEIVKTKIYPDSLNYQSTIANVKLTKDGSLISKISRKTKGLQYDNRFYLEKQKYDDIIEYYKEFWGYVNNLEILNYNFINDKNNIEFSEEVSVEAYKYSTSTSNRILFKPNIFNRNNFVPKRYRNRKMAMEISRGYLHEDSFIIKIPDDYEIEAIPESTFIETDFGNYSFEIIVNENVITYKRSLYVRKGEYPNTSYSDYRDFRKKVSAGDNSKIVLKSIK
ncbi:MAG: DUF3857 domain-containing protein [Flavobacteriaceae bacterium]|nr:DUF3857 domain-containing protein [Flavobacteriaceae bacterium]|tara:strand:- start:2624 stop:4543 length:1920 start_codon:yes stop_codon:yes gene_type:complete